MVIVDRSLLTLPAVIIVRRSVVVRRHCHHCCCSPFRGIARPFDLGLW